MCTKLKNWGKHQSVNKYSKTLYYNNTIFCTDIRKLEMKKLKKGAFVQAISSIITPSISILGTVFTILGYTLNGKYIS